MDRIRRCCRSAALAGATILCGSLALAQTGNPTPAQDQGPGQGGVGAGSGSGMGNNGRTGGMNGPSDTGQQTSLMDKNFVRTAMEGGLAEVELGKLALQKTSNDQVKQFAQRMVDDHTKLNQQMEPIAQQLGVSVPKHPSKKDQATMAKLQALSGTDFDKAYIKDMVKDHTKDEKEFQQEASSGQDPSVKEAATQGATVINQHLQMAQQMAKDQNVSTTGQ